MIRDITLGQYFPGKSLVHRMDARVKIVLTFVFIIFIFIANNLPAMLLMVGMVLSAMLLSGISVRQYLKSLKAVIIVVALTSVLNLFYGSGDILVQWGFLTIRTGGVINCIFIAVRIISLILFSSVLTFTTSPTDLTDALERIMKPLKVFHVKVHEIAMMMTIALRFVPTLLEETDKIMSAQKARGADMESGGAIQRAKALIPILIPLFVSSFRRAYELAMAMECRCYRGGEGRTKMKSLHMTALDGWAVAVSSAACVGVALCVALLPSLF